MASHVSPCMEGASSMNRSQTVRRRGKKKGRKGKEKGGKEEKKKEEKRRKMRKKKRKRGKGKRKRKECYAVSRTGLRRTRNCATRGRFPPTLVILCPGAT